MRVFLPEIYLHLSYKKNKNKNKNKKKTNKKNIIKQKHLIILLYFYFV